ncbi:MAG: DUF6057 family protein [Tannerellaceae bacterium]|jgi:hypothetical protein|nr:DUF6057 family protein [Tannerellaceae bacterium]
MNRLSNHKGLFFWPAVYAVLFAFLQTYSEFHFYFVEQNQLFQNIRPYVMEHLCQPGGAALILSEFLTQFFLLPYAGAGITAALLVGAGWLAYGIVKQIAPQANLLIACLLPVVSLMFAHFDFNYPAYGTVAFLMAETTFFFVMKIKNNNGRFAVHLAAIPLLFCLAGPVFLLYALLALLLLDKKEKNKSVLPSVLLWAGVGIEALLTGILSVYFALYGEYRHAFLPDGYYHPNLAPRHVIYFSWYSLMLLLVLARILRRKPEKKKKRPWLEMALQTVLIAALCRWGVSEYGDKKLYRIKELDYYCRTEQWDMILTRCEGTLTNYLYILYANLALLQKGELGDRMFAYDQRGPQGLLVDWNKTASISILLSDVYFAIHATSLSQEMAFQAYMSTIGEGNPRMLKRLVQTNLVYGAYPVAEKYIAILEHTYGYSDWAKAQRRFLYNDTEVENDPLLGNKRRCLATNASLSLIDGLDADLQRIAVAHPADRTAITYAGAFYLAEKNPEGFQALIEKYYATPVLPTLPIAFQEAIIILSEKDPDYWQRFGVSDAVAERFAQYKRQVVEGNRSGNANALPSLMRRAYGDTYWFYYMFK